MRLKPRDANKAAIAWMRTFGKDFSGKDIFYVEYGQQRQQFNDKHYKIGIFKIYHKGKWKVKRTIMDCIKFIETYTNRKFMNDVNSPSTNLVLLRLSILTAYS